jgi:hypothetical protein
MMASWWPVLALFVVLVILIYGADWAIVVWSTRRIRQLETEKRALEARIAWMQLGGPLVTTDSPDAVCFVKRGEDGSFWRADES